MDIIGNLPPEIAQQILLYLGPGDILVLWNNPNLQWKHLLDNPFWKKVCSRNGYQENAECLSSNIYRDCMSEYSIHWQAVFKYHFIASNWRCGTYKHLTIANKKKYEYIKYFDDEILIVGDASSLNGTIDVISLSTGEIYFSFDEEIPTNTVRKTLKHRNFLIFFLTFNLKVWNFETKTCIINLAFEAVSYLYAVDLPLEISDNLLAFVNFQSYLHVVNLETKELDFKTSDVASVSFGDNTIILVSSISNVIKVLDLKYELLMSINYGEDFSNDIKTKGGYVIICYGRFSVHNIGKIHVYSVNQDTKSLQEVNSVNASYNMIRFINDDTILFLHHERSRRWINHLWKFATDNRTVTVDYEGDLVELATINKWYLFLLNSDFVLHMWCINTGKCIRFITDDMFKYHAKTFDVTEKKLVYLKSDGSICIQNYDFIENNIPSVSLS